ncbi:antirepressor [Salmonella enterica subsp. enterica]|uniref:Antirepressor n=1 Tax=Salmonella enterica I TaxID=59201 RepID=A0A379UNJ9_SALET|nr:antirepressor [Salmonella enterica subsp. enterica]
MLPATPRCSKQIRLGRCSKNWRIAIFSQTLPSPTRQVQPAVDMLNIDLLIKIRDGNVKDIRQVGPDMFVGKVEQILSGLRDSGWIVIKRDLLAEKLATW